MEPFTYFVPSEKHHRYKCGFEKKGHNTLYGQWRTKNIAHKPGIVGPVGTELKFQYKAGGHTNGKVNTEQGHPEFSDFFPFRISRFYIDGLHNGHDECQPQRKGYKHPVIHSSKCKLCTGPIYQGQVYIFYHSLFVRFG